MEQKLAPVDIARQAFVQLAKLGKPPTPENYQTVYNEIAGLKNADNGLEIAKSLQKVLLDAGKIHPKFVAAEHLISTHIQKKDWLKFEEQLRKIWPAGGAEGDVNWSVLIRTLLKQMEANHKGITLSRKKEGLSRVLTNFASDPNALGEKIQALISSWGNEGTNPDIKDTPAASAPEPTVPPAQTVAVEMATPAISATVNTDGAAWRDMVSKSLEMALIPALDTAPDAQKKAQQLLDQLQNLSAAQVAKDLRGILLAIEIQRENQRNMNQSLSNLLNLLVQSMGELVIEDEWLKGQISIVNEIIHKPLSINTLYDAESSLRDLIHKQSNLKPALDDAKALLKQMAATFVDRLVEVTESTDDYHTKIEIHQKKLEGIDNINELNLVLKNILDDTRNIGLTVQRTREEFHASQKKVAEAEQKIQVLTAELDHISEVAHEDFLTGALNRRGMDEAFLREFSRSERYNTTISIAMMDIDHFKKLNDRLGHATGDEALAHFAKIINEVKRTTDVLARYGGEEFVIMLPSTKQEDAIKVIERVQRQLTKQFFLHKDEKVLITFSAGVAERMQGETADELIARADIAMYQAKNAGRNRVVGAQLVANEDLSEQESA